MSSTVESVQPERQIATAENEDQSMEIEVRADGTIWVNGKIMARTNNPDEVRRRAYRRVPPRSRAA